MAKNVSTLGKYVTLDNKISHKVLVRPAGGAHPEIWMGPNASV